MTWADGTYSYRKAITIDKTKVAADHTDFPVLVLVTDAILKDVANGGHVQSSSGYDICFYDANDSTKLNHELVSYVNTTGAVEFWVRKPVLDCDANDTIYMYYGKAGVVADQSVTTTWSSDYLMVQHMKDATTSTTLDSTSNDRDGAKKAANEPVETTGSVGKAQEYDGTNDYIAVANPVIPTGQKSVSMWFNTDVTSGTRALISNGNVSSDELSGFAIFQDTTSLYLRIGNGAVAPGYFMSVLGIAIPGGGGFHFIFIRYDGTTLSFSINGGAEATSTTKSGSEVAPSHNLLIGDNNSNHFYWDGAIDETRVSNSPKSYNWVKTEYNNQSSPGTFMSFAAEEAVSSGTSLTKSLSDALSISDLMARTAVFQRTVSDIFSLSDLISKKQGKILSEALSISDDFDYLRILLLSNTLSISDSRIFDYGKGLSNILTISDSRIFGYGKGILDTLSIADTIITLKYFLRNLSDTLTISDDFDYLRGFDTYDSLLISDSKKFTYGKNLSNILTLNDLIRNNVGYIRTVSDTLTISDLCVTSLYTAYFKVLVDTLTLNDLIRTRTYFNRSVCENLTMTETLVKGFHKILSDMLILNEFVLYFKTASYLFSIHDTVILTSALISLKNQTLILSDTLIISDLIMAISSKDMEFLDSTGSILVYLRRPYWDNLDGNLTFNSLGFAFRSGNYTSYLEDINDESITFTGYESANDVLTRFNKIADIADNGTEITIVLLGTTWDATYIISNFTYKPIGLDIFEYTITLKLVR